MTLTKEQSDVLELLYLIAQELETDRIDDGSMKIVIHCKGEDCH